MLMQPDVFYTLSGDGQFTCLEEELLLIGLTQQSKTVFPLILWLAICPTSFSYYARKFYMYITNPLVYPTVCEWTVLTQMQI